MNEMRRLMETIADLDFDSFVEPLASRGEWLAYEWSEWLGESFLLYQGTYEECVRAVKIEVQKKLKNIEGDAITKKKDRADGGVEYYVEAIDNDWKYEFHVVKGRAA